MFPFPLILPHCPAAAVTESEPADISISQVVCRSSSLIYFYFFIFFRMLQYIRKQRIDPSCQIEYVIHVGRRRMACDSSHSKVFRWIRLYSHHSNFSDGVCFYCDDATPTRAVKRKTRQQFPNSDCGSIGRPAWLPGAFLRERIVQNMGR